MTTRTRPCGRQRGAALLLAMLTVALVATLSAAALWQQWRAMAVESAERQRVQASWILGGALDWARLILREDGRGLWVKGRLLTDLERGREAAALLADKDGAVGRVAQQREGGGDAVRGVQIKDPQLQIAEAGLGRREGLGLGGGQAQQGGGEGGA